MNTQETVVLLEPVYRNLLVRTVEEAIAAVEVFSKRDITDVLTDYMTARHYDYALNAIIRLNEQKYPILYRGSRFENSLLVEGATIDFGPSIISTSQDIEVAAKFAADDYLPEGIYEDHVEFGRIDADAENFEEQVDALYGNILFEIHDASGLFLNPFFDFENNFTKEKEVIIENRSDRTFKIVSIEPYTFKFHTEKYPLKKVVVKAIHAH